MGLTACRRPPNIEPWLTALLAANEDRHFQRARDDLNHRFGAVKATAPSIKSAGPEDAGASWPTLRSLQRERVGERRFVVLISEVINWTPTVSSGGAEVMVSRLRQRALVTGQLDEGRRMTYAITWDDWHESLRSDLLRRAEAARHHPDAGWLCRRAPGEHPDSGGHSEFARETATGAIFKAADLIGNGWTGVHISDENYKIYWPDRFDQLNVGQTSGTASRVRGRAGELDDPG
jgi:hypothetical protein